MDANRIMTGMERLISILHIAILFLAALAFSFVFIINWEDWFFGIKLAGPAAGVFLAARAAAALMILYLVMHYPDRGRTVLPLSIAYFGFLFANAFVTYQTTAPGAFPVLPALLVLIPVLQLLLKLRMPRPGKPAGTGTAGTEIPDPERNPDGARPRDTNPLLLLFLVFVVVMVLAILIVPYGTALVVSNVPFLQRAALPPAHDTILFRVNQSGGTEWEIPVRGYSLDFIRLASAENGSFLLYGTYFLPDRDVAQIRVLKIDRQGRIIWDVMQGMKYGIQPDTIAQIEQVNPSGQGAIVWLTNGTSLRIDGEGNITAGSSPAGTVPEPAVEDTGPAGFASGQLPAKSVMIRIRSGSEQGLLFPIEDTLAGREILSIYSINPTADGGYLVSASA